MRSIREHLKKIGDNSEQIEDSRTPLKNKELRELINCKIAFFCFSGKLSFLMSSLNLFSFMSIWYYFVLLIIGH